MIPEEKHNVSKRPPRWADRFLEWYCRPDLLEEIQGDAYELYYRTVAHRPRRADLSFCWNVIRFFRWKNIRKSTKSTLQTTISIAMLKNVLLVSFRNFIRQPGHTSLNVAGLGIGFCCVLLILLWVTHEFSYDRFHQDSSQIFKVISHVEADGSHQTFDAASAGIEVSSIPEVESLVTISNGTRWPYTLCFRQEKKADECVYLNGIYSSAGFFSVFNFPVVAGGTDPLSENTNIAISQNMAEKLYGSDSPIGKIIKVDGFLPVTIASVFQNPPQHSSLQFDFVMPFAVQKRLWGVSDDQFKAQFFPTYIKTVTPSTVETLTKKLNQGTVLTADLRNHKVSYQAYPFTEWHLRSKFENGKVTGGRIKYIRLFIVIGTMLLLLAVINYINMATAKATTRAKEIGIRKVTGAYRNSIIFQFLSESFLLVFTAFMAAILLAQLALPFFSGLIGQSLSGAWYTGNTPFILVGLLLVVATAAGIYPAFVMSSFQPVKILKKEISSKGTGSDRLRKGLLLVQLVVSLVILNFSGVMYYQLNFIHTRSLGFEHSNTLRIEPTVNIFKSFDVFKNELKKDPSIISVAASNLNPIGTTGHNTSVTWPGKPADTRVTFQTIGCSYEFPETIGLKVLDGRGFLSEPVDSLHTEVLLTSDAVKTMNLSNPIGEHIEIFGKKHVIIGIINDFHTESLHQTRLPVILYRTDYMHTSGVYVRYKTGTTKQSLATVSAAYKSIEPSFTMKYWFQDETFDDLYKTEKTVSRLVVIFTGIALLIAVIGVVSLSTFNVLRKTKEIGVRRVFGASVTQVMALLSREFLYIMVLALALAIPISWYISAQWLSGFAYHTVFPWWLFPVSFLGITLITVLIICAQGMRTITANPTQTLHME